MARPVQPARTGCPMQTLGNIVSKYKSVWIYVVMVVIDTWS